MHYFFYERFYPRLPFWWVIAINHHFSRSETYRQISCEISLADGETDWVPPNHRSGSPSSVADPAPAPHVAAPAAPAPGVIAAQAAPPEESLLSGGSSHPPSAPAVAPPRLSALTVAAIRDFRDRCARNMVIANDKGA
ncbi:MAG TPA: hypothetical protein PLV87_08255, partial [Opitutaceae bacterium]|nr:hypothetical protein [Opitutaceae bacterium]